MQFGSQAERFRGAPGRRWRLALCGLLGSGLSALAAILVSFALLDITFQPWARLYYSIVYLGGSLIILMLDDTTLMRFYRRTFAILFAVTGAITLMLQPSLKAGSTVPIVARVAMFTFVSMTLCISVVLSCILLVYMAIEWLCHRCRCLDDALLMPGWLLWICIVTLVEGMYFGLIFGFLEQGGPRPRVLRLPHADPELALPVAALLGAVTGVRLECMRQGTENYYSSVRCAVPDSDSKEEQLMFAEVPGAGFDGMLDESS